MIPFWPVNNPLRPEVQSTVSLVDQLAAFSPEIGIPITRPRTTSRIEIWNVSFQFNDFATFNTFEDWFNDVLLQGSRPFLWLHPTRSEIRLFKFNGGTYDRSFFGFEASTVTMSLFLFPSTPTDIPSGIAWWTYD